MGIYSGWDLFLLKYGGEVFLYKVSSVWFLTVYPHNHTVNFTLSVFNAFLMLIVWSTTFEF